LKRFLLALLVAACSATRLTHMRGGWRSCHAADRNLIECGGRQVAQVECFEPGDEACGALAVRYTDGERVFLSRPAGFEPGQEAPIGSPTVLRPELASDGSMIWFRSARRRDDYWTVFEPQTGITRQVDAVQIFQIRERDPHSMPLWVAQAAPAR
jgi:hypothetical protein